ncbi:MAG: nucleotidyltransferase family protein [Terracidiphilus sp.]
MPVALSSRPELTLLRTVARVELIPSEQDLLHNLLAGPLDWEHLLDLAFWHGLEPLLFLHLNQYAAGTVFPKIMQALRQLCKTIARNNLILASNLQSISAQLRSRKIEHIVYKGPLLAVVYYGNCGLRVSCDLDIIVPPQKLEAARDALGEIGFSDKKGLNAAQQAASFRFGFEHTFVAAGGLDLELHWGVVPKYISPSLDMAGIWKRVKMAPFFNCEVPTFCPEDLLVALCLHAGQHEWIQLSHFCDIAQLLLVHPQLDWDIVRSHLGDSNTTRTVYVSLRLLHQHWRAQIPEEMMARISADQHVVHLADRIQTQLWPSTGSVLRQVKSNLRWLLDRSSGEDVGDRLRFLEGTILTPTLDDFELFKLPKILVALYPGLRALRLVCKYISSWRRLVAALRVPPLS